MYGYFWSFKSIKYIVVKIVVKKFGSIILPHISSIKCDVFVSHLLKNSID